MTHGAMFVKNFQLQIGAFWQHFAFFWQQMPIFGN